MNEKQNSLVEKSEKYIMNTISGGKLSMDSYTNATRPGPLNGLILLDQITMDFARLGISLDYYKQKHFF